jgi:hypothetical protein
MEIYSFALIVGSMFVSSLFLLPSYYWLFLILAFVDALSTRYRQDSLVAIDRMTFAFVLLLLSAQVLGFGILYIMVETVLLIGLLDVSFLMRKIKGSGGLSIVGLRLRTYLYSLVPALLFSFGMVFIYSELLGARAALTSSPTAVLELGLASFALMVLVVVVVHNALSSRRT